MADAIDAGKLVELLNWQAVVPSSRKALQAMAPDLAAAYLAQSAELAKAQDEALQWRIVAMSATPGGSEYTSRERTSAHIRDIRKSLHDARMDRVRLTAELARLRAEMDAQSRAMADLMTQIEAAREIVQLSMTEPSGWQQRARAWLAGKPTA